MALTSIKNATTNWLGKTILVLVVGLIAISFAIWGIEDMFRGYGQSSVARVGDREIGVEQFRQTYMDRLQQLSRQTGRPVTPAQARTVGLDRQVLAQTIAETALDERVRELGLAISDSEVARRVVDDPTFRGLTGQFDRARFDQMMRQIGFTEQRFMNETRNTVLRQQLLGAIAGSPPVPRTAVELFHRYQNEQRSIEMVRLDKAQAGEITPPSEEALAKYYEERKISFRAPEYRSVIVLSLTPEEMAAAYTVSEDDLKKAYEDRRLSFETPERREIQQIVFPNAEEAKAAAEKIAAGVSFDDIAKERGLSPADMTLGTLSRQEMIDTVVAEAAFSLDEGGVSEPLEGRFGNVLIRVSAIKPGQTQPLEKVADDLRKQVALARAHAELLDMHDKIEDERLSGVPLAELASKLGLKTQVIEAVDRSGRGPDGEPIKGLPQNVDLISAVFSAEPGIEQDPLTLPSAGGYVWYDVTKVTPARDRTLDEVRERVVERWTEEEVARQLQERAKAILSKVESGASLAAAVADMGLKPEWRPGLQRGAAASNLSGEAIRAIFETQQGKAGTAAGESPQERVVFQVNEISVPKLEPASEQAQKIEQALRNATAEEMIAQYIARLEAEVGVNINQSALRQVVGGGDALN